MATQSPIANGIVTSLAINGEAVENILFGPNGPQGDDHVGFSRRLSKHDGGYINTSKLVKGSTVFNWRSWTGLSLEEIAAAEQALGYPIPIGCLLENITISGIPDFSKLEPTSRLVFPERMTNRGLSQAILAVWEENAPCDTVATRIEGHYQTTGLKKHFIRETRGKRGVMGFVLSAGAVQVGDQVLVFPPVR